MKTGIFIGEYSTITSFFYQCYGGLPCYQSPDFCNKLYIPSLHDNDLYSG